MYPASEKFKEAIYAPIRTAKGKVTFDISDTTIADDTITTTTPSEYILSDKSQLTDKKRESTYNYATLENDRFKLDGSFSFADEVIANNQHIGWCSDALCDSSGIFSPNLTLTFVFGLSHNSMGITITFDTKNNEYATDFDVKAYNASNSLILTQSIVGNSESHAVILGQYSNYKKVEVVIKKWSKPYRRARVGEVDFGVVKIYTDDNLIKFSLVEGLDLTSGMLPSTEFKFTVDNSDRGFNILNPIGFYKFLQERQQVVAEIGLDVNGIVEYVPLGNYLLLDWTSDEGAITASFTARTNLDLMSAFDYENLTPKSNYNLYKLAVDIFTQCRIKNYQIDTGLQSISTKALIKKINCKDLLQMIAIASCSNIYVTRENKIGIKVHPANIDTFADEVTMDNMYSEPQIELDKIVKSVSVLYFTDIETSTEVVVNNTVLMGDVLKVENNTLIETSSQATNVANWILKVKNYRATYTTNWRGNPALELNDIVSIENSYGDNMNAIITNSEINYEGYLSAKTVAKGVAN